LSTEQTLPRRLRVDRHAPRLAEVEVAGQLAQDQDVEPLDHLALQRRRLDQLVEQEGRPEVGEQLQVLAQAQQGSARPHHVRDRLVAGDARRAEQDGVGLARNPQGLVRQGIAGRLHARLTDRRLDQFETRPRAERGLQHLHRLAGDLRPDAVPGQHCDFHARELP
jgi:hypothetical protein